MFTQPLLIVSKTINHISEILMMIMTQESEKTCSFNICSQCKTICCQDAKPPLTRSRKKIIKQYLKESDISINQPFYRDSYCYPSVDEQLFCSLFNKETGKCIVHSFKPETCVAGPITFDINFSTLKIEWFLKKSEICALGPYLYDNRIVFREHFEAAKVQLLRLIYELAPEELRAILEIQEPMTFKIGEDDMPPEIIKKLKIKENLPL
jgi:uncharacterized protein